MRSNDEIPEEILRLCLYYGKIPSLTFYKAKTAIAPVFIRGVAVFVFALICTIFEIVLFFLLRFFDDCPHICLRDEFIIRSETEGCMQGIC